MAQSLFSSAYGPDSPAIPVDTLSYTATVLTWLHLITALNCYLYNATPVVDFCCCGHQKDLDMINMPWDDAKKMANKIELAWQPTVDAIYSFSDKVG